MPYAIREMVGDAVKELPDDVVSILTYVLGQLIRLPGIISSEISMLSLVASIQEGIDGLPEDTTLAVKAGHAISRIILDRDKVFIRSDWFKGLAVEVLRISQVVLVAE